MTYVVVTGLPASGKSTLAAALARALDCDHLDKDAFLEDLLGAEAVRSADRRHELSRLADSRFRDQARARALAVLSSWWKHPDADANSGTDVAWLQQEGTNVVEIHCACPAEVAVERFVSRRRHPGHLDALRTPHALMDQFARAERLGPLFPTRAIVCNTASPVSPAAIAALAALVRQRIAATSETAGPFAT